MKRVHNLKQFYSIKFSSMIILIIIALFSMGESKVKAAAETYKYSYTGEYQEFIAPMNGRYRIQLWGAQGGDYDSTLFGGLGGYTEGEISLLKGTKLYIYVGGQASSSSTNLYGGWNGGGNVPAGKDKDGRAGGGATDIRTVPTTSKGTWNVKESLASRIMVAAGGGGAAYESSSRWRSDGGPAGGLTGYNPLNMGSSASGYYGTGGTQIKGGYAINASTTAVSMGTFGLGGQGISTDGGSGGGGGWYGGGGSNICSGGGGGSSYISGHDGCVAVTSAGAVTDTTDNQSHSWTGYIFNNTKIIDGTGYEWTTEKGSLVNQPTQDNTSVQTGNAGNGFAMISSLRELYTDNTLKSITTDKGTMTPTFDPKIDEYNVTIGTYDKTIEINSETNEEHATLVGNGTYDIKFGSTTTINLAVTSESGNLKIYTVNVKRANLSDNEHTTKLAELELINETAKIHELTPEFDSNETNYYIDLNYNALEIALNAVAFDQHATVTIEGNDLIVTQEGDVTIRVSEPHCTDTVYTIHYEKGSKPNSTYEYEYIGDYQTFTAPTRGKYKIELWGAQGASSGKSGGYGAYTSGDIILNANEILYIYVGNSKPHEASFNGGGLGRSSGLSGGGATDVRLTSGPWNNFASLKSRIMVAAGGGGAEDWAGQSYGGAAGGLYSYDVPYYASGSWGYTLNTGATQTEGGKGMYGYNQSGKTGTFGTGGEGGPSSYGGAGGGGYYGGGGGGDGGPMTAAGSGGSSYISGHPGVNSISEDSTEDNIIHTDSETHYSKKKFTNTVMIDGMGYSWKTKDSNPSFTKQAGTGKHVVLADGEYTGQPTTSGEEIQTGQEGNGYAKITPYSLNSDNNYLQDIKVSSGTLSPSFSATKYEYDLILDKEVRELDIEAIVSDESSTVTGSGHYAIKYNETTTIQFIVTSTSGNTRTYIVNVKRKQLEDNEHTSRLADLDFVISKDDVVPILEPNFDSNTFEYNVSLAPNMIYLDVKAGAYDKEAKISIEGTGMIIASSGDIKITVTEPNSETSTYLIHYKKEQLSQEEYTYNYTGDYQTFTAPIRGNYRFELWGAQGANASSKPGGLGAYTKGNIFLEKGETLYIYVGDSKTHQVSYNGGGLGRSNGFSGGGATDVRLTSGPWNNFASLKSRIMVAAGGGGAEDWAGQSYGGAAGGLYSYDVPYYASGSWGYTLNTGATQTEGGKGMYGYNQSGKTGTFGTGGEGGPSSYGGAGGGGYYGGGGGGDGGPMTAAGSGGSSYISGHPGVNSISEDSTEDNIIHTDSETHYSKKKFTNTVMIDGMGYSWKTKDSNPSFTKQAGTGNHVVLADSEYTGQPTTSGEEIQTGQEGYGYAKVTPLFQSKNNYLLNLETDYGAFDKEFSPFEMEYTLTLDKYEQHFTLTGTVADENAEVSGLGKYEINLGETKVININVTALNGEVRTYRITVTRGNLNDNEHSTKLVSLKINNNKFTLTPEFISSKTKYKLEVPYSTIALDVEAIPYDKTATIKIEGNGYLNKHEDNIVKIIVTHPEVETTTYEVTVSREQDVEGITNNYACTNSYQTFTAPGSTYYKVQLWGASGGYGRTDWALKYRGGYGAYTEGEIYLSKGQKLYVYVGCIGEIGGTQLSHIGGAGGFNGGSNGGNDANRDSAPEPGGGGGGATDIRLTPTSKANIWNEFNSLKSRIMVAAGGGGGSYYGIGGAGGSLQGIAGYGNKTVPNQTSGYAFGYGMPGIPNYIGSGGAGGGYYGGYTAESYSGTGGNSFVSGCEDCVAIDENSTSDNIIASDSNKHYSNYIFSKIKMATGEENQPNPQGGYQTGNDKDGYAIITASTSRSENNFLKSLSVDNQTLTPEFDKLTKEYNVTVDPDDTSITINAELDDEKAVLVGTGTFNVEAGTNSYSLFVTAENGDIRVYTINVTRDKSNTSDPLNIKITGLVESLCSVKDEYCNLTPSFNPKNHSYELKVPSRIKQLGFEVEKSNINQSVSGNGINLLEQGENKIEIKITSEDGTSTSVYTYNVIRDMAGDNNIDNLVIVNPPTELDFKPEIADYYISVPETTSNLELQIDLADSNATYEVVGNENFQLGLNIVKINVTAQNGDVKTYTLNVYQEQSGNTFLSSIKVSHDDTIYPLTPEFNKVISNYIINVPNDVDNVNIEVTKEHALTTVSGDGNVKLNTGTNKVNLVSTASDGSVQIYELYIIRAKSNDATLKSLDVLESELNPSFDPETEKYNLDVNSKITSLNINAVVNNPKATYKISGNNGFTLGQNKVTITVTAENGTKKTYTLNVNKIASSNNYLSSLTIDKYDMSGIFNKETEEYNIVFEDKIPSIKVSATPEDSTAKVSKTGIYNIKTGTNKIKIIVTAEDGSTRTYTLNIFQTGNKNNNLISLVTSSSNQLTPTFNKDTLKYNIDVDNNEDEITVIGVAEDSKAVVTGNGTYHLDTGNNTISIVVTPEEGEEKTYEIVVNRKKSSNADASLIIAKESVLDPKFDKDTTMYYLKVLEDVTSLSLNVELDDETATYEVTGNSDFVIGHNTVNVIVTAEDKTQKTYVLDVLRQAKGTTSDKLESLTVNKGTLSPTFDKETIYYNVDVDYETTDITIDAIAEDKNAKVEGTGDYELKLGKNVLSVSVTSTEDVVRYYQVIVNRKRKTEARLSSLQVTDSSLDPNFDKDTFEYSLKTNYNSLSIKAIPLDKDATYKIINNQDLNVGNHDVIVRVTAQDGITTQDYVLHVQREKSLNNNLKSLEVQDYKIDPEFSKTTTIYKLNVDHDVNNIVINATAEDASATIAGDGTVDLNMGKNYIDVIVTSEAGTKKVYTIIVNREASGNNYLSSLIPSTGSLTPNFDKETNNYQVEVDYDIEEITIFATPEDAAATITGLQKYKLSVGDNKISITVTAEDGSTNIYNVNVIRKSIVSSKILNLTVDNYNLEEEFSPNLYDYTLTVDNETQNINLNVELMDKNATYKIIGNNNLTVGMNIIKIEVTDSEGKETSTYTLNVNKKNYSNNFLNYIYPSVGELSPTFDKETLSYTVEVESDVTAIDIFAAAEIETNTVEGTGHYQLNSGDNKIELKVISSNNISRSYFVNVIRKKSSSNDLTSLTIKANDEVQSLSPTFDKETLDYEVNVPVGTNNVEVLATASENASISGIGKKTIVVGRNEVNIIVTSESGLVKTYTITINREASNDNKLLNIIPSIGSLDPVFNSDQQEYTLMLNASASMLSFNVITSDANAKVSGIDSELITDGSSIREIKVTAENNDVRIYKINVYKDKMDEARLSNLEINGYKFNEEFNEDKYNYTITLPNSVSTILANDVIATPIDSRANISKTDSLVLKTSSTNIYSVIVTAKDGFTKKTYTIEISREKSSDSSLAKLEFANGKITPDFTSNNKEYTLILDKDVSQIKNSDVTAIPTDDEATVTIPETFDYSSNNDTYEIKVESADKSTNTTYIIHVKPNKSNINILDSLTINHGILTPEFNSDVNEYTVDLTEDIEEIEINATADPSASITGTGKFKVISGENIFDIVVTAEDGSVNTYTIKANKAKSSNNNVVNIIPSHSSLTPTYNNDIDSYQVEVDESVDEIDFDVVLEKETANVIGNKDISLNYGENNVTITVTAEDGSIRNINITVIRNKLITDIVINSPILMEVGEVIELNPTILPEDATNKELEFESSDISIVKFENNKLIALAIGDTKITISSKKNKEIKTTVDVSVLNLKLESSEYDIIRDDTLYPYILGAELKESLAQFKTKLRNKPELIHFYSVDNTEITDLENEVVKTGSYITLEFKNKEYDKIYIVVRGEINGDGEINVKDYNAAVNHTLKKEILENYWFASGNVEEENEKIINVKDSNKIKNKILKKIESLNPGK